MMVQFNEFIPGLGEQSIVHRGITEDERLGASFATHNSLLFLTCDISFTEVDPSTKL